MRHARAYTAGDRWFVDETYAKISGRWVYLYRAWGRGNSKPTGPGCLQRARHGDLTNLVNDLACPDSAQRICEDRGVPLQVLI